MLKKYDAPVIWVTDWADEIEFVLDQLATRDSESLYAARARAVQWYDDFKTVMADELLGAIVTHSLGRS